MAYAYSDFLNAAKEAGLSGTFDDNDLSLAIKYPEYGLSLVSLRKDLGNAQTNEQRLLAREAENQLRKNYGQYAIGTNSGDMEYASSYGGKIGKAMDDVANFGSFEYGQENDYKNMLDRVTKHEGFSYDPEKDPLFASYKKAYNREGDRASADALAKAAALTGGRASSYAGTAAQEAANYYASKLADAIPQLRGQALEEYNNEYAQLMQGLNALSGDRSMRYGEWQDERNARQQELENLQKQDETDYKRFLDELNAAYQRERDVVTDTQQAWDNAIQVYQLTGQITGPLADYLNQNSEGTAAASGSGGSGGGSGGGVLYSGNTAKLVSSDEAEAREIMAKYRGLAFRDGTIANPITSWADYSRLKELLGYDDATMNENGIYYAYPATKDAAGNLIAPKTIKYLDAVKDAAGNTKLVEKEDSYENYIARESSQDNAKLMLEDLRDYGESKEDVLAQVMTMYLRGIISDAEYDEWWNKYNDMDANKDFGKAYASKRSEEKAAAANAITDTYAQVSEGGNGGYYYSGGGDYPYGYTGYYNPHTTAAANAYMDEQAALLAAARAAAAAAASSGGGGGGGGDYYYHGGNGYDYNSGSSSGSSTVSAGEAMWKRHS